LKDNRSYYDDFAATYDCGRDHGYHAFVDESESALVAPHARDRDVLEVGCGTGRLLARVAPLARRAVGVDLSPGMLAHARARGLDVVEGDATSLPFDDASFDVAFSFKVLPHVEDLRGALREMARVVRPGGVVLAELYNARSLRALAKRLGPAGRIGHPAAGRHGTTERDVFTRFDTLASAREALPPALHLERVDGLRVFTPWARLFDLPILGPAWDRAERLASRSPLRHLGGFLVLTLRRVP
jgi:ubiquinone/menaquinone biosynthesis C-methylase UbiE